MEKKVIKPIYIMFGILNFVILLSVVNCSKPPVITVGSCGDVHRSHKLRDIVVDGESVVEGSSNEESSNTNTSSNETGNVSTNTDDTIVTSDEYGSENTVSAEHSSKNINVNFTSLILMLIMIGGLIWFFAKYKKMN